ncbi:MAG: MmcQ/YjbR family DNA-binding protein [Actinomycetota bacterium]|jgi:predicted DNA-binding protein (MmcQ/YjbR family)|nr:MmcQ/YjbR family DNA-binding protein [Actinomycetota bacterium]
MKPRNLVDRCLEQPEATEEFPFGDDVSVIKVAGKMFALVPKRATPATISLKCDPDFAISLRARYAAVIGGYHLNKQHWNTVTVDGSIDEAEIVQWIEDSYDLVVDGLPKKVKLVLQGQVRALSDPPS